MKSTLAACPCLNLANLKCIAPLADAHDSAIEIADPNIRKLVHVQSLEGEEITGAGGWFEARAGSTYEFQVGGADGDGGILNFTLRLRS